MVIPKPGKKDYTTPRAYRPIALLECFGKLIEKLVAKHLTFLGGKFNLISPNQFGGRSNTSTVDTGLSLVHDIQSAWHNGKILLTLMCDFKGYYDHIGHKALICML